MAVSVLVAPDNDTLRRDLKAIIALEPNVAPDVDLRAFVDGEREDLPASFTERRLVGTPDQVAAKIRDYVEVGLDHFMLWFMDAPRNDGLELFADQVMPVFASEEGCTDDR